MSANVIDRSVLTAGLTQLGLSSNLDVLKGFESYAELLLKWNKVYNLTAIRNAPNDAPSCFRRTLACYERSGS